jgi:nitrate/TMAO reductase-like tetraheme cytochrome c subunit
MTAIIRSRRIHIGYATRRAHVVGIFLLGALLVMAWPHHEAFAKQVEADDSCVECHRNPDFLVQNKKLYDYFQQWQGSIHDREGVACSDCHGGDPEAKDKDKAHGDGVDEASENSEIHFKNVSNTCGQCHEDILEGFKTSEHFEHVVKAKQEKQGPTCITCHGSIDVDILNVNSVKASCARCHNDETGNQPENPAEAQEVLNDFLSIHRFYRYLTPRMDPAEAKAFFSEVDMRVAKLSVTWHTFDLDEIEDETHDLLKLLRHKRDEVRSEMARPKE